MIEPHSAELALASLRDRAIDVQQLLDSDAARRRHIAHLEGIARRESLRGKRRRWLFGLAAAASVILCAAAALRVRAGAEVLPAVAATLLSSQGDVSVLGRAEGNALGSDQLPGGCELVTMARSSALLSTSFGARVSVDEDSRLLLVGRHGDQSETTTEQIRLLAGEVSVEVPHLGTARGFEVLTPDATVIVHGTRFTVHVEQDGGGAPETRVEVSSGRVEVRRNLQQHWLGAGATWTSAPSLRATSSSNEDPGAAGEAPAVESSLPAGSARPKLRRLGLPAVQSDSRLAKANRLMIQALEEKRRGSDTAAVALLDELLDRYPDSPIAPNARREKERALARLTARAALDASRKPPPANGSPATGSTPR